MNLDTAANAIGVQQDLKVKDIEEKITADFQKTHKIWSTLPHSSKTTTFGEGLLKNVHDRHIFYEAKCVGLQKFQCLYVGDELNEIKDTDTNEFSNVPIPLFSRVREVSVAQDGTMSCNCYTFESVGHYCAHQVCIAKLVHEANDVEFHGFTHHDICLRYQTAYMHLAYRDSTPNELRKNLHILACNPIEGPKLRIGIPDNCPIEEMEQTKDAIDRLINYKKEDLIWT